MKNSGPGAHAGGSHQADLNVPVHDTPLLPTPPLCEHSARATLTLLTGVDAGHVVALDTTEIIIGRASDAGFVIDGRGVSGRHARVGRDPDGGYYVEDLASTNGTFLGVRRVRFARLHGDDVLRLGPEVRLRFAVVDAAEADLHRRLYEASLRDPLTHVFNRRYLADRLLAEVARARRAQGALAVLMIDVDHLKDLNDHFGHLAGDRALCVIAARIQQTLRVEDVLARYGGDEFTVLAIGAGLSGFELAERIRRAVASVAFGARGLRVHVTVSIGVASLDELASDEGGTALLALADARLYGAKNAGRNRVSALSLPVMFPG